MTFVTYSDQVVQNPGENSILYFEASEDILQGQLLELDQDSDSSRTVEPSDTDGGQSIGFAEYGVSSGDMVAVAVAGAVVRATTGTGSIQSGDPVTAEGSTGEEGELKAASSGDWIIGTALFADGTAGAEGSVTVLVSHPNPYGNPSKQ